MSVIITIFILPAIFLLFSQYADAASCITYDSSTNVITVTCGSANLTDIDNQLKDASILVKQQSNGIWLLNAGIVVANQATLYINSTDTAWLRLMLMEILVME